MRTDKNDMKVKKSVSMHLHAFERPCKRQIVTDPESRNASHINGILYLVMVQSIEHTPAS